MANKSAMHDPVRRRNAKSSQLEFFGIPSCSGTFLEDIMAATIGAAFTALTALQRRIQRMINTQLESNAYNVGSITQLLGRLLQVNGNGNLAAFWLEYLQDSAERAVLTSDVFRVSGDLFHEHEAAGCPPVLFYEHEVIIG
ncbi:hypothetical protein EHS39_33970 [Ensifer sp. MPMI2T]|nr:hypothetical protein EHS39_33970 [Ensifer sp. MPMI2T]